MKSRNIFASVAFGRFLILMTISTLLLMAVRKAEKLPYLPPDVICEGIESAVSPLVFDFETDDRLQCEIHNEKLTRMRVPVSHFDSYKCIYRDAPHGRLAAYSLYAGPDYVEINRCERCATITEKRYGRTRVELEEYISDIREQMRAATSNFIKQANLENRSLPKLRFLAPQPPITVVNYWSDQPFEPPLAISNIIVNGAIHVLRPDEVRAIETHQRLKGNFTGSGYLLDSRTNIYYWSRLTKRSAVIRDADRTTALFEISDEGARSQRIPLPATMPKFRFFDFFL